MPQNRKFSLFLVGSGACAHRCFPYLWKEVWRAFCSSSYFWNDEELTSKIFLVIYSEAIAYYSSVQSQLKGIFKCIGCSFMYINLSETVKIWLNWHFKLYLSGEFTYYLWSSSKITTTSPSSSPLLSHF